MWDGEMTCVSSMREYVVVSRRSRDGAAPFAGNRATVTWTGVKGGGLRTDRRRDCLSWYPIIIPMMKMMIAASNDTVQASLLGLGMASLIVTGGQIRRRI